jgi:hypothetical protein
MMYGYRGVIVRGGYFGAASLPSGVDAPCPGGRAAVGQVIGADPLARDVATGRKLVSAVWLQRALNARGQRLAVDGAIGTRTMSAANTEHGRWLLSLASHTTATEYTGSPIKVDTGHATIAARWYYDLAATAIRVADPAGSTVAECAWSAPTPTTTTTTTTPSSDGAVTPTTDPGAQALLDQQLEDPPGTPTLDKTAIRLSPSSRITIGDLLAGLGGLALGAGVVYFGTRKRGRR